MSDSRVSVSVGGGGVIGSVIAVIISWALNHHIGWAIIHFLCGWLYVIYAAFARAEEIIPAVKAMFGV
jgi:hypothetical protein